MTEIATARSTTTHPPVRAEEKAFRQSEIGDHFNGKLLEPLSHLRQTLCLALGLKYWRLGPDELRTVKNPNPKPGEPNELGVYDALPHDVALVIWSCSQPDDVCRRARAEAYEGGRDKWDAEVDKFADANGLTMNGDRTQEAARIFIKLVNQVDVSTGIPDHLADEERDGPDDPN